MTTRKILLGIVVALLLAISPAMATALEIPSVKAAN